MKKLILIIILAGIIEISFGQEALDYRPLFREIGTNLDEQPSFKGTNLEFLETSNDSIFFGIDFSHYTGHVDWNIVGKNDNLSTRPLFIILRSTVGADLIDDNYHQNRERAKEHNFLTGSYHYFRSHEKGRNQAFHYLKHSSFDCYSFIPIVDIEYKRKNVSADDMRRELLICLQILEEHIGVKPMIYSNLNFYKEYLRDYPEFSEYPVWIAAYSDFRKDEVMEFAQLYQYTDQHVVEGIEYPVDANLITKKNILPLVLR